MKNITNPILPGFNPDPSICRVGDDFYIATSTFEWFPGVQIHHSRDLVNWRLLTRPLDRVSQLDMRGNPCSGGIWAPCLTYADGLFWLIYTDVKTLDGMWKDTHNYLVTAPDITGPWSDPIYLNSSGFDPSLFHDDDGRKWLVNMRWEHQPGLNRFSGIPLQEYDHKRKCLTGKIINIFRGTELKATEGPHLYKRNGWYYLLTAEGGTGPHHAVTLARAKTLEGPYEIHPQNPVLTSANKPELELWKAGHASICDTPSGEWYMVHLCARPFMHEDKAYCMLGRETAIQKVQWDDDGWLRLSAGGNNPLVAVPAPDLSEVKWPEPPARDDFTSAVLDINFQSLRVPVSEDWLSLTTRPGWLRLYGRESLSSRFCQSMLARRIQHFDCEVSTRVEFAPEESQQMAGLAAYYNVNKWYYLAVTADQAGKRILQLIVADMGTHSFPQERLEVLPPDGAVDLRLTVSRASMQFYFRIGAGEWRKVGPALPAWKLSDEYGGAWGFTGAFAGLCCQDLSGRKLAADFDWFEYLH